MYTFVSSLLGLILGIAAMYIVAKKEVFVYLAKRTASGFIIFVMPLVVIISEVFFILSSIAPDVFLASIFVKFAISWLRFGMVLIWLFSELIKTRRFISVKTFVIVSIYSASVLTYSLSNIVFIKYYGFWERIYIYGEYYTIDHFLLSILQIITVYSLLTASIRISRRVKSPHKKRLAHLYFVWFNFIIIFAVVAWMILVFALKLFSLFAFAFGFSVALLPFTWLLGFRKTWFAFYVGLVDLLGIFVVDAKTGRLLYSRSNIVRDQEYISKVVWDFINLLRKELLLNVRTIFLEDGVLILGYTMRIIVAGMFSEYVDVCAAIVEYLAQKIDEFLMRAEHGEVSGDLKIAISNILEPFLP